MKKILACLLFMFLTAALLFMAAPEAAAYEPGDPYSPDLTIAPGRHADEVLEAPGTKVLMKTGRQLPRTLEALARHGLLEKSAMVCNCGLPDEAVFPALTDYDPAQDAGYFATILVKE